MKKLNMVLGLLSVGGLAVGCAGAQSEAASSEELGAVSMHLLMNTERSGSLLRPQRAYAMVRHIEFYLPEGVCAPEWGKSGLALSDDEEEDRSSDDAAEGGTFDDKDDGSRSDQLPKTDDDATHDDRSEASETLRGDGTVDDHPSGDDATACEDKLRFEGPWVVDLVTGETIPAMDELSVPAGTYRRIDVRFEKADAEDVGQVAELADWTLVASGEYAGDGATGFDMQLQFNEDARFESAAGIHVSSEGVHEMVLALDVNAWFGAVTLQPCLEDDSLSVVDGRIQIDEEQKCGALENAIKEIMKDGNRLQ